MVYPDYTYKKTWPSSGIVEFTESGRTYAGPIEAFTVKFRGRKAFSIFGVGHLSLWRSEFYVDKMLEVRPIPNLYCPLTTTKRTFTTLRP